jgi:citrate/tricarballylate utilization protein
MHATETLAEADRLMTVCNSCRYCEGLCAVFPAMEARRVFADGDLNYLANLCHGCGACYFDCQFAPPHEFNVNVPRIFAQVRSDSYRTYAWPSALSRLFVHNALAISFISLLIATGFALELLASHDPFAVHRGAGAFYLILPHRWMVLVYGSAFSYSFLAIAMSVRRFWGDIGEPRRTPKMRRAIWQAIKDAGELRYLDGGGGGCMNQDEHRTDWRKFFHHLTLYGFLLCFVSTVVASLYHFVLGREAPYPWFALPVISGTLGGLGLVIGPAGLLVAKLRRDPAIRDKDRGSMDVAFIVMLLLTGLSGLGLLLARETAWMGPLLSAHLSIVLALFVTMPYGKFVHGVYRFLALVRYARDAPS